MPEETIEINGQAYNLTELMRVSPTSLEEEATMQFGRYASWAVLAADSEAELQRAKANLESVSAEQDSLVRDSLAQAAGKKPTEAQISAHVALTPEYARAREGFIQAQRNSSLLRCLERAFFARKDMIQVLSSLSTRERRANVTVGVE